MTGTESESARLVEQIRAQYGHFFVARLLLKMGREIPKTPLAPDVDRALVEQIRETCKQLGKTTLPDGRPSKPR